MNRFLSLQFTMSICDEWDDFEKLLKSYRKKPAFYPTASTSHDYMYGRYTKNLAKQIKIKNEVLRKNSLFLNLDEEMKSKKFRKPATRFQSNAVLIVAYLWRNTFAKLGEDWVFLALLGIIMAVISYIMDTTISICNNARIWLNRDLAEYPLLQYVAWISLPMCLILFSAGFVQLVAPQSIGSGIPEMKTILRGVALKEYLTFRTLIAKIIGLTATLGSGLPIGKEGPFVHIASIVATLLTKLVTSFKGIYENESRNTEMLAAACAVGVASCFAAPVGGVLFSIEVTTVYFAVRNYWRGFFAAVCGATVFRLLAVWFENAETVSAVFKTNFTIDYTFEPEELIMFAFIGILSGVSGAFYVWLHSKYVTVMRSSIRLNTFLQKNRLMYPGLVTFIITSITFPLFLGQFMGSEMTTHSQVLTLFSNFPMTKPNLTVEEHEYVKYWLGGEYVKDILINFFGFLIFTFIFSIISSTIPVPSGIFIPVFKIGAALGRIIGECTYIWFPRGIRHGTKFSKISPGSYAIVGSAAFSGAVTHTISVSVIVCEMTGQITLIIPMMMSVLISNAVANLFTPSIYDSIILIKKLPYLPDLLPSSSKMYSMCVEHFMSREIKFIFKDNMTYATLKTIVKENKHFKSFPMVDRPERMILLGSVQRTELVHLIDVQIGKKRRLQAIAAMELEKKRRPSRFQVTPAPDDLIIKKTPERYLSENHLTPKKSILKKQNSFTMRSSVGTNSGTHAGFSGYSTVTGADNRVRQAFEAIFQKSNQLKDLDHDTSQAKRSLPVISKKVQLPSKRVCDMSEEEQVDWIKTELEKPVDFTNCQIDTAPFQLVEKTSLLKAHSLFSLIGIDHAYVTVMGKLVGIVGLKELRKAIEEANSGNVSSLKLPEEQRLINGTEV